jgi:diguanylate cyclase (GGDEF)-like protein
MAILPEETITYAIAEDQKNNLWIGTYYNGLYYYDFFNEELINYRKGSARNNLSDNLVYDIIVDSKDRVWVATNDGLNMLKPGAESFQMFYSDDTDTTTLASQVVRVVFEDSKGRIWIGMTSGGVALYNEDTENFINYTEKEGLSSNIVLGIQECVHGSIWVSTHSGISIIDPENNMIEVLTPNDGIGGWEFNTGSAIDQQDNLYFGGVHGITVIPKKFVDLETPIPKVYIKDVQIFGESLDPTRTIFNDSSFTFDYSDQYISFDLSTIFYDAPEQVRYFYKLDGFDDNWVAIGSRNYISFSNLLPGDYVLNVRAKTLKTDFSEIERVFFTVNKPWYLEYWAFIIYLAGLVLMFYFGSKVRQWYMLKYVNENLSETNKELSESNKDLEEIATRDPLTGLYNRRYFNELMKDLVNIAKRESSNLIFVMLDIDHFKAINDTFGHLAGDDYLIDVANILQEELRRSTDFAVRYAGDEFALVLFDTTEAKALAIANGIKERINGIKIRKEYTAKDYSTTVSMGMVFLDNQVDVTPKEIFKVADNAMYKVKNSGRDNIEVIRDLKEGDLDD